MSFWRRGKIKNSLMNLLFPSMDPNRTQQDDGDFVAEPPKDETLPESIQNFLKPIPAIGADEVKRSGISTNTETAQPDRLTQKDSIPSSTPDEDILATHAPTSFMQPSTDPKQTTTDDNVTLEAPLRELFDESYALDPLIEALMERVDDIKAVDLAKDLQDLVKTLKENTLDQEKQS